MNVSKGTTRYGDIKIDKKFKNLKKKKLGSG
jgi:hypothetical protein